VLHCRASEGEQWIRSSDLNMVLQTAQEGLKLTETMSKIPEAKEEVKMLKCARKVQFMTEKGWHLCLKIIKMKNPTFLALLSMDLFRIEVPFLVDEGEGARDQEQNTPKKIKRDRIISFSFAASV